MSYYDRIRVVLRSCLDPITIVNWILYDREFHRNDRISVKKIDFVRLREESNALFVDACLRYSENCPGSHCRYSL